MRYSTTFAKALVTAVIAISACAAAASAGEKAPPTTPDTDLVYVTGLKIGAKTSPDGERILTALGEVRLEYKGSVIDGEEAWYNTVTKKGSVFGAVRLRDKNNTILADRFDFDAGLNTGVLLNPDGVLAGKFMVQASSATKIGETKYDLVEPVVTTCICKPGETPAWSFAASHADFELEGYAWLTDARFRVGKLPLIYMPWWMMPTKTKRASGMLIPLVGSSSINGFTVKNYLYWAINDQMDATYSLEYMALRGFKHGLEYRYAPAADLAGEIYIEYLRDRKTAADFWKLEGTHTQKLPLGAIGTARLDLMSENSLDREFTENITERTRRNTDSYVNAIRSWGPKSLNVSFRQQKSIDLTNKNTFARLPEIIFESPAELLGSTPLAAQLTGSATSFVTEEAPIGAPITGYKVGRLALAPQLSAPLSAAPWLTLTPSVSWRENWYSRGIDSDSGFLKDYYTAGFQVDGPKLYRIFEPAGKKLKHVILPSLTYNYGDMTSRRGNGMANPAGTLDSSYRRIKPLDGLDFFNPQNNAGWNITNRLLSAEKLPDGSSSTREMMRLAVFQQYSLIEASRPLAGPTDRRKPFGPVVLDFDSRIIENVMLNIDTGYDLYGAGFTAINTEIGATFPGIGYLAYDRRYVKSPYAAFSSGLVGANLPFNFSAEYSMIYDEAAKTAKEAVATIKYTGSCWSAAVDIVNRYIYSQVSTQSGVVTDKTSETRLFLTITLEGLGEFGARRPRIIERKL